MLDIKFIRENPEQVKDSIRRRKANVDVDRILELDTQYRLLLGQTEKLRAEKNKLSETKTKPSPEIIQQGKQIKQEIEQVENQLEATEKELKGLLLTAPNLLHADVPDGKDESENVVLRKWGKVKKFDFKPKDHLEIGESLDIIDVKTAAKISGARFGYLKGGAAMLEVALIQHVFQILTSEKIIKKIADSVAKGYSPKTFIPVFPPVMIKPEPYIKMARLSEQDKDERYYLPKDDLYLIGSAEHTLGSMHIDQTLAEEDLPLRYLGFSTSFRREAGSYGKDTKGILRVHQFDKAEMESFTLPENSEKEQEFFVAIQEYLMQSLEIPYQVVAICSGDMGDPDFRQIDINAWLPGQNRYRETHTSDLMLDYQARRLKTKVKRKSNKTEFAHMNDATAFAMGRTIIAILENYQQKDGSIKMPKVLQKYLGFKTIKAK